MSIRSLLPLLTLLALVVATAQATPRSEPDTRQSAIARTETRKSEARTSQAKDWGLTEQEWARYEAIKAGPRGYWSPGLDPLTALGVEARNDKERQRYAELQVQLEAKRVERELAYNRAYTEAWTRLFPDSLPIQRPLTDGAVATPAERTALFVEDGCEACVAEAKRLQASDVPFDIYLVGSQGKDARIQTWARKAGIRPDQVRRQRITLNHDNGQWFRLGAPGVLPVTYQRVNGQWQRLN